MRAGIQTAKQGAAWTQKRADGVMAAIAMTWGSSYLLMKIGLNGISPFSLIALRFGIAFLAVALIFRHRLKNTTGRTLLCGSLLGLLLFGLFAFLLHGMRTTSASNAGFLTSTTVIWVPLFHAVQIHRAPDRKTVAGTMVTMLGIGFLTLQSSFALQKGDLLCLAGAVLYAFHILLTDVFSAGEDGLLLGAWQLGFAGLYGLLAACFLETPSLPATPVQWGAVLGLAFLCSAFGFVMQPVAQKYTTPEHTSLLFALEPVFSSLFAFLFLKETLSAGGYLGAALVLTGVLISSFHGKAPEAKKCNCICENGKAMV